MYSRSAKSADNERNCNFIRLHTHLMLSERHHHTILIKSNETEKTFLKRFKNHCKWDYFHKYSLKTIQIASVFANLVSLKSIQWESNEISELRWNTDPNWHILFQYMWLKNQNQIWWIYRINVGYSPGS